MLEMLIAFDKFCQKHGLTYYLSGGTLLGAVRHKGFIPWDDDIDVNMPRPDCEKLMQLSEGQIDHFEVMPPNPSTKYFSYHWKLYADSILVAKRVNGGVGKKVYPVFMDIFPIEGLPETAKLNNKHFARIIELKKLVNRIRRGISYSGGNPVKKIISKALNLLHSDRLRSYSGGNPVKKIISKAFNLAYFTFGIEKLYDRVISHAKKYKFEDSTHVGVMMTNVHTIEERVLKSEYTPIAKMQFEGYEFPGPAGFDTYLRQLYGPDYMAWLPIEKRFPKHNLVTFHNFKPGEKPTTDTGKIRIEEAQLHEGAIVDLQLDD
jgi:lipopolysaccharide cholinephosphotransferase